MYDVAYPQSVVRINGHAVQFVDWEVENNSSDTADTFKVKFCVDDLDKSGVVTSEYIFYTQDDIYVEIFLGFGKDALAQITESQMDLLLSGFCDEPEWDFHEGCVTLSGRDKTALLLDNRVSGKFSNKTVEEVIRQYAAQRGLAVSIDPKIAGHTKKVGKVSNGEWTLLADGYTEWDLLAKLADEENRDVYVQGNTLYYRPRLTPSEKPGLRFKFADSLEKLNVKRTLKNTKGLTVTVRSWNKQAKRTNAYQASVSPDVGRASQTSHKGHRKNYKPNYTVDVPNLSPAQAKEYASNLAHDIHDHELNISFSVPTRPGYNVNKTVYIDDIPILAKQHFVSKRITTKFSVSEGARSDFECVNHILASKGKHK